MTAFRQQFQCPTGRLGRLAGAIMYYTNDQLNGLVFDLLDVQPGQCVLEIGSGPGRLLGRIAMAVGPGRAVGLDPSSLMVEEARRHNRPFAESKTLWLATGTVSGIPFADATFDRVCTVNTFYFWPNPAQDVAELCRTLRPDGRLVVAFRVKPSANGEPEVRRVVGDARHTLSEVVRLLQAAGLREVETVVRPLRFQTAAVLVARP